MISSRRDSQDSAPILDAVFGGTIPMSLLKSKYRSNFSHSIASVFVSAIAICSSLSLVGCNEVKTMSSALKSTSSNGSTGNTPALTGAPTPAATPGPVTSLVLTPASVSISAGATQQYSVVGRRTDGTTTSVAINFSAAGGSINSLGLFTAGATPGNYAVTATQVGGSLTAVVPVVVNAVVVTPPPAGVNFVNAPAMSGVSYTPNDDSAVISVPWVKDAKDYRVVVVGPQTSVSGNADGSEAVANATIFCAGVEQHSAPETLPIYNATKELRSPYYQQNPNAPYTWVTLPKIPLRRIQVTGLSAAATVYVEAIDKMCPFTGVQASKHFNLVPSMTLDINNATNRYKGLPGAEYDACLYDPNLPNPYSGQLGFCTAVNPIVTEAETRAAYSGNMIYNGQGIDPRTQPIGMAVPMVAPKVLARASLVVTPQAIDLASMTFFDNFQNPNDRFVAASSTRPRGGNFPSRSSAMQNSKWNLYTTNSDFADTYFDHGTLHTVTADTGNDVMSTNLLVARKPAHLPVIGKYLHAMFEVDSASTDRRYWLFAMCGPQVAGQLFQANGLLTKDFDWTPFFHSMAGLSPSVAGWQCLQVFPRSTGGGPDSWDMAGVSPRPVIDPSDNTTIIFNNRGVETAMRMIINKPLAQVPEPSAATGAFDSATPSVMEMAPPCLRDGTILQGCLPSWLYTLNNASPQKPVAALFDDESKNIFLRTKVDLYIAKNRVVMYINGKQRFCTNMNTASAQLNMAEAAVSFDQIFYHSSGERVERLNDNSGNCNNSTGQNCFGGTMGNIYFRHNSPFVDNRTWDNLGFKENDDMPADFDASVCYNHDVPTPDNNE